MFAYDQVLDPTTASHSLVSNFTTFQYDELVVVCTNIIKIYRIIDNSDGHFNSKNGKDSQEVQLRLRFEFPLVTPKITSLERIPGSANLFEYDKLIIGTGDKLSIVQFNDIEQSLDTKSLHYYVDSFSKKDDSGDNGIARLRMLEGIESCVLFKANSLVHLKHFQNEANNALSLSSAEGTLENPENDDGYAVKKKRKYQPKSLALKSTQIHSDLRNIIDFQNDCGSLLYFLYSPEGLKWSGSQTHNSVKLICLNMHLDSEDDPMDELNGKINGTAKSTVRKSASMSFQTQLSTSTLINSLQSLPDDIHSVIPIIQQPGSILLIGVNQLLQVDENFNVKFICKLNSYCDLAYLQKTFNCNKIVSVPHEPDQPTKQIELSKNPCYAWLTPNEKNNFYVLVLENLVFQFKFQGKTCAGMELFDYTNMDNMHSWQNIQSMTKCELAAAKFSDARAQEEKVFISFAKGDSVIVNFKVTTQEKGELHDSKEVINDEDDIYDTGVKENVEFTVTATIQDHVLPNFGPITSMAAAPTVSSTNLIKGLKNPNFSECSLIAAGPSMGNCLYEIQPSVQPIVERGFKFIDVTKIWNLDNTYLITTDSKNMRSDIFLINKNFKTFKPQGFSGRDCITVDIQMSVSRENIIHVTNKGIFVFGYNFEEKSRLLFQGARAEVVHVSIQDDFILTTNVKGEIGIYEMFEQELYEINLPTGLNELILTSGSIMKTQMVSALSASSLIFTFVTADNHLIFFYKDHDDKIFEFEGVCDLTKTLRVVPYEIPDEITPDPFIKQVMIAPMGKDILLSVLTFEGEVYIYKQREGSITTQFDKTVDGCVLTGGSTEIEQNMYYLENFTGKSVIIISGIQPFIIMNELNDKARCYKFGSLPLMSLGVWFDENYVGCKMITVDNVKNARILRLDVDGMHYGAKLPVKRHLLDYELEKKEGNKDLGEEQETKDDGEVAIDKEALDKQATKITFNNLTYYKNGGYLAISYYSEIDYVAKNELGEPIVTNPEIENGSSNLSKAYTGGILLLKYNAIKRQYQLMDKYETESECMVNCLQSLQLQVLHVDDRISMSATSANASATGTINSTAAAALAASAGQLNNPGNPSNLFTPITHQAQHEYLVSGETYFKDEDTHALSRLVVLDVTSAGKLHVMYKEEFLRGGLITCLAESKGRIVYNESEKLWIRKVMIKMGQMKLDKLPKQDSLSSPVKTNGVKSSFKRSMLLEPVAFADMPSLPTKISEFNSLILTSCFHNGLFMHGFEVEPYRLVPISKGVSNGGSLNNELLVNQGDCYQLSCNGSNELTISKFANDDPLSMNGTKLIEWSTYKLGTLTSVLKTVPHTEFMTLACGLDGSVYTIIPLRETSYRRLNIVQQQIIEKNLQLGGLNYRMERQTHSVPVVSGAVDIGGAAHRKRALNAARGGSGTTVNSNNVNTVIDMQLLRANFINASIVHRNRLTTLRMGNHATKEIWRDIAYCDSSLNVLQSK
ncbi:hypothetical protein ACO0QE_000465 [Hanseniaspora vineae]